MIPTGTALRAAHLLPPPEYMSVSNAPLTCQEGRLSHRLCRRLGGLHVGFFFAVGCFTSAWVPVDPPCLLPGLQNTVQHLARNKIESCPDLKTPSLCNNRPTIHRSFLHRSRSSRSSRDSICYYHHLQPIFRLCGPLLLLCLGRRKRPFTLVTTE